MTRDSAILQALGRRGLELLVLLISISTLLFFLLRLSGDPAAVLAGEEADAATVALISQRYGFDDPLYVQYLRYLVAMVSLDFGNSLIGQIDALTLVVERLGATLLLAFLALLITAAISIPLGAWLGFRHPVTKMVQRAGLYLAGNSRLYRWVIADPAICCGISLAHLNRQSGAVQLDIARLDSGFVSGAENGAYRCGQYIRSDGRGLYPHGAGGRCQ